MSDVDQDVKFMKHALRLAARGQGTTSPNPMVGAVIVAKGKVVGSGYHKQAGGPHAEVFALQHAKSKSRQATLYLTLEPCCHTEKRTPPCVPDIIESGVRRVVVAMRDPNPQVAGRGIRQLKQAGIVVDVGCLKQEATKLNEIYIHWVKTGLPFVILKSGMTLDGKIATAKGESKWITGPKAREHVHQLRSRVDAIAVGVNTVLKDDPQLTARLSGSKGQATRQPVRLIFDSRLRIPFTARVLQGIEQNPTAMVTTKEADPEKVEQLRSKWVEVLVLPQKRKQVSIRRCLQELGNMGITSVLVEGGSELNASFLREGLVNQVYLYMAPTLLGGSNAKGLIGGLSPKRLAEKNTVSNLHIQVLGDDVLIIGDVKSRER
ncbi:MAG: bifunctional diaminohydroxyphosphoribosylaminopyrimidine deaminase/5-amino-6-(5-phosphoribosylamino)uracil reductase RibD [Nitrospirae bacterium]|nr:bifunctional diaminohydroxyphosphoribosylaminopyrimidine deaminase/5-amino-6-(5-phosphoribosylamino)uracil reductase RibD [Nitrospirota bacterium]MDA1304400.1 bifunctional diaminohydroxyphosphoribosylaminopyrimidine deaminase/5-amino-6-(5-phosphoribosylamino)uracil reductase RibD [Nitrospirota bacterium]